MKFNRRIISVVVLLAAGVLTPSASQADTPLVSGDPLDGAQCAACSAGVTRTSEGGAFTPEGWSQNVEDSRIIYDLGRGVACARITFEATGWDPNQNMVGVSNVDNYHDVFGVFEGIHGDPSTAVDNGETHIDIQVVAAPDRACTEYHCRSIKLNAYAVTLSWNGGGCPECRDSGAAWCQACGGWGYAESDTDWSTAKRYSFEINWNYEGAGLTVSEIGPSAVVRQTSAGWLDSNPMRYFFLGGDRKGIDKEITGPVYTNVQIWEVSPCANPCEGHCSNGVQDCVEETVDNGGKCAPDAGSDAGVADSGFDAAFDAGDRPDTWVPDTGAPDGAQVTTDAGMPDDAGVGPDIGQTKDTGTPADAQTPADAGKKDAEPFEYDTLGCGCATLGI